MDDQGFDDVEFIAEHEREHVERLVFVRPDGAIVWESILDGYLGPVRRTRLLNIVADNITNDDRIDWKGVWLRLRVRA